jgi:hypothetical protein
MLPIAHPCFEYVVVQALLQDCIPELVPVIHTLTCMVDPIMCRFEQLFNGLSSCILSSLRTEGAESDQNDHVGRQIKVVVS